MMIYHCPTCGKWVDVRLARFVKDAWNHAMKNDPEKQMPLTYPCEDGHGLMVQVRSTDRISLRKRLAEGNNNDIQRQPS